MILKRTHNEEPTFHFLTVLLDNELNARYGKLQKSYDKHNVMAPIQTALVGFVEDKAVACGCFKAIDTKTVEIKRMFVVPECRRRGYSSKLLGELEQWADSLGYQRARLETGKAQPEAIAFYQKQGYTIIENFEPYTKMPNSICMEKKLRRE